MATWVRPGRPDSMSAFVCGLFFSVIVFYTNFWEDNSYSLGWSPSYRRFFRVFGVFTFCRRPFSIRLFRKIFFLFKSPYFPNRPAITVVPSQNDPSDVCPHPIWHQLTPRLSVLYFRNDKIKNIIRNSANLTFANIKPYRISKFTAYCVGSKYRGRLLISAHTFSSMSCHAVAITLHIE